MPEKKGYDIFLSYSRSDARAVETVARYLSDVGLDVWLDQWLLIPGQPWQEALEEALERSSAIAVFIGPSPSSPWQLQEMTAGLTAQTRGSHRRVIPILLPGASRDNIPPYLRHLTAVDLREGLDNPRELNRLITSIKHFDQTETVDQEKQIGDDLRQAGDPAGALAHYERALQIAIVVHGESHPLVATLLNQVAGTLQDMGELERARSKFERALEIDSEFYGTDFDESIARDYNNIGSVLRDQGKLDEALTYFQKALEIDERTLGHDHPKVAADVNNLGSVLYDLGDLAGARPYLERALAIWEKVLGREHPNTATSLNNLGALLQDLGDLAGARPYLERALATREKVLGAEHPDTANSLNNLGVLLQDLGDLAGARAHYERALQILRQSLGEDHPDTVTVRGNLESLGG